jgi:autotransporter-associated beta strand protein
MSQKIFFPPSRRLANCLAASAGLALIAPLTANAATIDWSGTTDGTWATGANWVGGVAPANSLLTDIANFNLASYTNQPDAGTTSIKGITIGASSSGLILSGTALSIGASGIAVASGASASTISAPITLGAAQTWTNDSANTLTVGAISPTAGSGTTLLFSQTAASTPTNYATSATDTNGMLGGWAIIKTGASTYGFAHSGASGTNTISAATTSTLGTSFSGDNSTVNWINSDGNTTLTAATQVNSFTSANDVTVSGLLTVGSGGVILGNNGSKWIKTGTSGQITTGLASGELFIHTANTAATDMRLWTQIVDNGATPTILVKDGPGYLGLQPSANNNGASINNTYTGGSILNGGTIALSGAQPLGTGAVQLNDASLTTFSSGNNATSATVANNIAVSGNTGFTVNTGGNLTLSGTLTGSGTLTFGNNGANSSVYLNFTNSLSSGSTITVANNINSVRFGATSAGSTSVAFVFNNTSANKNTLDFASGGTISFGSMTGSGLIQGNGAGTRTISAGAMGLNETFSGIVANGSGTTALTKVGTGTWTLSGANTYTGATTITAGTLALGASERISNSSAMVLDGGTFATGGFSETLNTLTLSSTSAIDFGLGTSALVFADSSAIAWTGTLTLTNFDVGTDTLNFTSSTGLTASQLSAISLTGYTATGLDASGFVTFTAVPEPHEFALAIMGLLGVMIFIRRRNLQA